MRYFKTFLLGLLFFVIISCTSSQVNTDNLTDSCETNNTCNEFSSIDELNKLAISSFIIMSDNKGDSIEDYRFKNMVDWRKKFNAKFIIGLGDHLKINRDNKVLDFLVSNTFWLNNFYPAIADGENEYYGESQGDWGAGKKFLELLNFDTKDNVVMRGNGVEYYAKFNVGDLNIHLIQLHFPDEPSNVSISWPQDSRDFLINTLNNIKKTRSDLIIVGAHSINGRWYQYLSESEFQIVMDKVDLGLSATLHIFGRYKIESHKNDGTLFINTGAISNPRLTYGEGFVYVFILDNPKRIVLQYIDPKKDNIELDTRYPLFIKNIGGLIEEKIIKN